MADNKGEAKETLKEDAGKAYNHPEICPICLQDMEFATVLSCGHIFCFLCVKGIAFKSRKCALCRAEISLEFLENPKLLKPCEELLLEETKETEGSWFYEGRNGGWWMFDKRTNQEIEENWKKEKKSCVVLIAGFCYILDFENLVQIRQDSPLRQRKIKRDCPTAPRKGIAGLRMLSNLETKTEPPPNTSQLPEPESDDTSNASVVSNSELVVDDENMPGTSNSAAHRGEENNVPGSSSSNLDIEVITQSTDISVVDNLSEALTQTLTLSLSENEVEL